MASMFSGACACGAVRYRCHAAPLAVYNCHCRSCQDACGAPFSTLAIFPVEAFMVDGKPALYTSGVGDASDHLTSGFCPACGTPLFADSEANPDVRLVRAATLRDATWIPPVADIWTISARPDIGMNTHIPKVYRAPPLLEKAPEAG